LTGFTGLISQFPACLLWIAVKSDGGKKLANSKIYTITRLCISPQAIEVSRLSSGKPGKNPDNPVNPV